MSKIAYSRKQLAFRSIYDENVQYIYCIVSCYLQMAGVDSFVEGLFTVIAEVSNYDATSILQQ